MEIQGKEIIASEGKYIHRIGSDAYFTRAILLEGESISSFEEVGTIPPQPTEEEVRLKNATEEKVKTMFFRANIPSVINTMGLTPREALAVKELHPVWSDNSLEVKKGNRYQCDGTLWEALKDHTTQASWKPGLETASLWKSVDEEHEGTQEDPIPYTPPMEIFEGKYYSQGGVTYKCTRDSGIPLSHDLSALIGTYVENTES